MGNSCSSSGATADTTRDGRLDGVAGTGHSGRDRRRRRAQQQRGRPAAEPKPQPHRRDPHHSRARHQQRRSGTSTAPSLATPPITASAGPRNHPRGAGHAINPFSDAPLPGTSSTVHSSSREPVRLPSDPRHPEGLRGARAAPDAPDNADDDDDAADPLPPAAVTTFNADDVGGEGVAGLQGAALRRMAAVLSEQERVLPAVPDFSAESDGAESCAEPSLVSCGDSRQPSHHHPQLHHHLRAGSVYLGGGGPRGSSASRVGLAPSSRSSSRAQHHPFRTPSSGQSSRRCVASGRSFMTASSFFAPRDGGSTASAATASSVLQPCLTSPPGSATQCI